MGWMKTSTGTKEHYVPVNRNCTALCGVKADHHDSDDPSVGNNPCKTCESVKQRAENGIHDEYDPHEVV